MIPKVKEWQLKTDDGRVYIVRGPTRVLAVMNLRGVGIYRTVVSAGVVRKPRGFRRLVTLVDGFRAFGAAAGEV